MPYKVNKPVPLDQDVYTLARQRMEQILTDFDHAWVSFSGGKDSTAVLNIVLETIRERPRLRRHLPLRVVFFDEEAIPYETEEYVRRVGQLEDVQLSWMCLPIKHRNACSRKHPFWWPWAPEDRDRWCRPLPPEAVTEWPGFPAWPAEARLSIPDANGLFCPPEKGNCAVLMGIRAQESLTRYRAVLAGNKEINYLARYDGATNRGNVWKAYPVYDWTTEDVWTAPAKLGWDYNRAYDRMEMAGVRHHAQRCSPAFGEEPIRGLHTYAQCFPDVWERMAERVPGVGSAVRYARTELYAYHGKPEKPDSLTWPAMVTHFVEQHHPGVRRLVADRVGDQIRRHYRAVSHPILPHSRHPVTGVDWNFLLELAMRGDFKERRQAANRRPITEKDQRRRWQAYVGELAQVIADGRFLELGHPAPPPGDPHALIPPEHQQEPV